MHRSPHKPWNQHSLARERQQPVSPAKTFLTELKLGHLLLPRCHNAAEPLKAPWQPEQALHATEKSQQNKSVHHLSLLHGEQQQWQHRSRRSKRKISPVPEIWAATAGNGTCHPSTSEPLKHTAQLLVQNLNKYSSGTQSHLWHSL